MPRFFFHIMDHRAIVDNEGTEMTGIEEVRVEAIRMAGRVLSDDAQHLSDGSLWQMTVADEAGRTVFALKFQAEYHGH